MLKINTVLPAVLFVRTYFKLLYDRERDVYVIAEFVVL